MVKLSPFSSYCQPRSKIVTTFVAQAVPAVAAGLIGFIQLMLGKNMAPIDIYDLLLPQWKVAGKSWWSCSPCITAYCQSCLGGQGENSYFQWSQLGVWLSWFHFVPKSNCSVCPTGFQNTKFIVEEPEFNSVRLSLPVIRNSGTLGSVTVQWVATINGQLATGDLRVVSGNVTFAPGETIQTLLLEVLADDVPEMEEVRGLTSIEWCCTLWRVLLSG